MGTRRVRSAVQASFNVAQGSVREPHRECAEEEDTPPSSSLLSSWPALGEERGQLTASSPFPLPSRPFVVRPERSCGRSKAAVPTFLFCCTRLMDCCELLRSAADKCCCLLTLSCKYFPSPIILSSYHPIILSFTPLQYGGELPKKGERWSAIEAVPFAAAQQWGGMGDTLMTTEKASLAFSILKRSCLEVRVRSSVYDRGLV